MNDPRTPDHSRSSFARTNSNTIRHRVKLLSELTPGIRSIAEVCGGDCSAQAEAYRRDLGIDRFLAVDIDPAIVAENRTKGLETLCADALDSDKMKVLAECGVVFFGPPLSEDCDGHRLLTFDAVRPGFADFTRLLLGEIGYSGLLVCIGPRTTDMGDIRKLHRSVQDLRPEYGLSLIHHSFSSVTGRGERTPLRCKYIELWFSIEHGDTWRIHASRDESE